jgi:hypothetical protein
LQALQMSKTLPFFGVIETSKTPHSGQVALRPLCVSSFHSPRHANVRAWARYPASFCVAVTSQPPRRRGTGWHVDGDARAQAVGDLFAVLSVALREPLREPLAGDELLSLASVDRMVLKCSMTEVAERAIVRNSRHLCDAG